MEPEPSNISGEKIEKHVFEHRVDWGYVAVGIAVIAVAWFAYQLMADPSPKNQEESLRTEV